MFHNELAHSIQYKYQAPNERSLWTLSERYFYFADPKSLNDPFELKYKPDFSKESLEAYLLQILRMKLITEDRYLKIQLDSENNQEEWNLVKDQYLINLNVAENTIKGIFSISSCPRSTLMWAHYTVNHTGWAIGFEQDEIFDQIGSKRIFPLDVGYQDDLPLITWPKLTQSEYNEKFRATESLAKIFSTKAKAWEYEKETRWFLFKGRDEDFNEQDRKVSFNTDAVKHIIFGLHCAESTKRLVYEITKNWDIKYYRTTIKGGTYLLDKEPWEP